MLCSWVGLDICVSNQRDVASYIDSSCVCQRTVHHATQFVTNSNSSLITAYLIVNLVRLVLCLCVPVRKTSVTLAYDSVGMSPQCKEPWKRLCSYALVVRMVIVVRNFLVGLRHFGDQILLHSFHTRSEG